MLHWFLACVSSVITDVLWLNFSWTDVLEVGANHNTFKVSSTGNAFSQSRHIFSEKIAIFPLWFLIRYQFYLWNGHWLCPSQATVT